MFTGTIEASLHTCIPLSTWSYGQQKACYIFLCLHGVRGLLILIFFCVHMELWTARGLLYFPLSTWSYGQQEGCYIHSSVSIWSYGQHEACCIFLCLYGVMDSTLMDSLVPRPRPLWDDTRRNLCVPIKFKYKCHDTRLDIKPAAIGSYIIKEPSPAPNVTWMLTQHNQENAQKSPDPSL